jgi:hypothetical protein
MDILTKYHTTYHINHTVRPLEEGQANYDIHKDLVFDNSKPTLVCDLDYTLLETNSLKVAFTHAFSVYDPKLTSDIVTQTYAQSKVKETYYDFDLHMKLLAQHLESNLSTETIQKELKQTLIDSFASQIHEWLYPNMIKFLTECKESHNFMIMTAGQGDFQRIKVALILESLGIQPSVIAFIEKVSKGVVFEDLYTTPLENVSLTNNQIILFDDNTDELIDVYKRNINRNIKLVRVKQKFGSYNHKVLSQDLTTYIIELNCENDEEIKIFL